MKLALRLLVSLLLAGSSSGLTAAEMGAVVIHGKWGSPDGNMIPLIAELQRAGIDVAAPEMPWSRRRLYDAPVEDADRTVDAEIVRLRERGARKIFVVGQSMGSAYAIRYAARTEVTGVVAIAPGHRIEVGRIMQGLAADVQKARELVAAGKGGERFGFTDFNSGGRRSFVRTTAAAFLSYFDPAEAFNMARNVQNVKPNVPVLWLVPSREDEPLRSGLVALYEKLPKNAGTRFGEPQSDHLGAPAAAASMAVEWIRDMSKQP